MYELFHRGRGLRVTSSSATECLEFAVQILKLNPDWERIDLREDGSPTRMYAAQNDRGRLFVINPDNTP